MGEGDDPPRSSPSGRLTQLRPPECVGAPTGPFSTGEESEWIRYRLQGGCERLDLLLGDWFRVDHLEGDPGREEDAHNSRIGWASLLMSARRAGESIVTLTASGTQLECDIVRSEVDVTALCASRF